MFKEILRGSAIIFAFKIVGAISLFLVHILISRYYGAEALGVYNLILSLLIITTIVSRLGLDIYVVKIIPSLDNNLEIALFLKSVFKIIFIVGLFVSIIFFFLSPYINLYIFKSLDVSIYLLWACFLIIPFTFFNVLPEIFRGFHDIKIYSFFRNISQNLYVLLALLLSIYFSLTINPIYILYSSVLFITAIMSYVLYQFLKNKKIDLTLEGTYSEPIVKYSYPMFLTSSMMFLMGYVDSFMISYYMDEYQVGIYSACIKLSFIITFVLASINGYIAPKISEAFSQNDMLKIKHIYYNSIKIIAIATAPIFIVLYVYPEFFLGLFGEEFKVATITLGIIVSGYLVNALSGSVGYILNMTDNQHIFMYVLFIGLVLNIVLNTILIPRYHLNGAAIATFVSMGFWNISSIVILKIKKIV